MNPREPYVITTLVDRGAHPIPVANHRPERREPVLPLLISVTFFVVSAAGWLGFAFGGWLS